MKKIFALLLILTACSKEKIERSPASGDEKNEFLAQARFSIPKQIHFTKHNVYPEGIAFDRFHDRFLISSTSTGTVGAVSYDGTYKPFIHDAALPSTLGLSIDEARKQVSVVCGSLFGNVAKVGIYDLETGNRIKVVNLAALRPGINHLADDITIDQQGNKYVTDAKSPIIYKIDRNGHPSVFFENQLFAAPPGFPFYWVGFNGIVHNRNGFLIVAFYTTGKLLKIPVNNPANFSEINLDVAIASPDGLLLSTDGKELVVVDNKFLGDDAEIVRLHSDDKWLSAKRIETFPTGRVSPTTATSNGKDVFVMHSYLHEVFFGAESPRNKFAIQKVPFEKF